MGARTGAQGVSNKAAAKAKAVEKTTPVKKTVAKKTPSKSAAKNKTKKGKGPQPGSGVQTLTAKPNASRTLAPPISVRLNKLRTKVVVKCPLYRIPENTINYDPTPTHLHLDTLKFSKKFLIDMPWPDGVTVDASEESEATIKGGVLFAVLNVVTGGADDAESGDAGKQGGKSSGKRKASGESGDALPFISDGPADVKVSKTKKSRKAKPSAEEAAAKGTHDEKAAAATAKALALKAAHAEEKKAASKLDAEAQRAEWIAERDALREERRELKKTKKVEAVTKVKQLKKKFKTDSKGKDDGSAAAAEEGDGSSEGKRRVSFGGDDGGNGGKKSAVKGVKIAKTALKKKAAK